MSLPSPPLTLAGISHHRQSWEICHRKQHGVTAAKGQLSISVAWEQQVLHTELTKGTTSNPTTNVAAFLHPRHLNVPGATKISLLMKHLFL
jgi:hypothetical protein